MALSQISFAELQVASLSFVSSCTVGRLARLVENITRRPGKRVSACKKNRSHGSLSGKARATMLAKIGRQREMTQ